MASVFASAICPDSSKCHASSKEISTTSMSSHSSSQPPLSALNSFSSTLSPVEDISTHSLAMARIYDKI